MTRPAWERAGVLALLILLLAFSAQGCFGGTNADPGPTPLPATPQTFPVPVATPWTFGSEDANPLEHSVLPIQQRDAPGQIVGAAVVVNSDGYLLSHVSVANGDVEVLLPGRSPVRPALLATEPETGLVLLKVPHAGAVPVRFTAQRLSAPDTVYAAGFDGAAESFGQISGHVSAVDDESAPPPDLHVRGPQRIETSIPLVAGFRGAALSDDAGNFAGIIIPAQSPDGHQVVGAISSWYASAWLEQWRDSIINLTSDATDWPAFDTGTGWIVQYPPGWTISGQDTDGRLFRYELAPGDPDAVLRLAVSAEPLEFEGDPLDFATEHFSERRGAAIWGELTVGGRPGVRVFHEQEAALLDIVYVFDEERLITFSMTSGYLPGDTPAQAAQAYRLFDVVVQRAMVTDP